MQSKYIWLVAIFFVALAPRAALLGLLEPFDEEHITEIVMQGDSAGYQRYADYLRTGTTNSTDRVLTDRTPGYPAFITVHNVFFGGSIVPVLITQVLIGSATALLVAWFASIWAGDRAGRIAGLIYALQPHASGYTVNLMADTLLVFLIMLMCICLSYLIKGHKSGYILAFFIGVFLAAGIYVKPVMFYLPVILALLIICWRRPMLQGVAQASVLLIAVGSLLLPWYLHNQENYGHFKFTSKGGSHLLYGIATFVEVAKTGEKTSDVRATFRQAVVEKNVTATSNFFDLSEIEFKIGKEYLSNNFPQFIASSMKGVLFAFANLETHYFAEIIGVDATDLPFQYEAPPGFLGAVKAFGKTKSVGELTIAVVLVPYLLISYAVTLGGLLVLVRQRSWPIVSIIVLFAAYFLALMGPVGHARYIYAFSGLYTAATAIGLLTVAQWLRNRYQSAI